MPGDSAPPQFTLRRLLVWVSFACIVAAVAAKSARLGIALAMTGLLLSGACWAAAKWHKARDGPQPTRTGRAWVLLLGAAFCLQYLVPLGWAFPQYLRDPLDVVILLMFAPLTGNVLCACPATFFLRAHEPAGRFEWGGLCVSLVGWEVLLIFLIYLTRAACRWPAERSRLLVVGWALLCWANAITVWELYR